MPALPATVRDATPSLEVATRSTLPVCGVAVGVDVGDRAADQADRGRGVQRRGDLACSCDAMFVICSTIENDAICCHRLVGVHRARRVLVLQLGDEQLQEAVLVQRRARVGDGGRAGLRAAWRWRRRGAGWIDGHEVVGSEGQARTSTRTPSGRTRVVSAGAGASVSPRVTVRPLPAARARRAGSVVAEAVGEPAPAGLRSCAGRSRSRRRARAGSRRASSSWRRRSSPAAGEHAGRLGRVGDELGGDALRRRSAGAPRCRRARPA